jgi:hypothetical protein
MGGCTHGKREVHKVLIRKPEEMESLRRLDIDWRILKWI